MFKVTIKPSENNFIEVYVDEIGADPQNAARDDDTESALRLRLTLNKYVGDQHDCTHDHSSHQSPRLRYGDNDLGEITTTSAETYQCTGPTCYYYPLNSTAVKLAEELEPSWINERVYMSWYWNEPPDRGVYIDVDKSLVHGIEKIG